MTTKGKYFSFHYEVSDEVFDDDDRSRDVRQAILALLYAYAAQWASEVDISMPPLSQCDAGQHHSTYQVIVPVPDDFEGNLGPIQYRALKD